MNIRIGRFSGEDAGHLYSELPPKRLLTRFEKTSIDFPREAASGYIVLNNAPVTISAFEFTRGIGCCDLAVDEPITYIRPGFLLKSYSFASNVDKTLVMSNGATFVELDELEPETLFERSVEVVHFHPRYRKKTIRLATSHRKPRVLRQFLRGFLFPLDRCDGVSLLRLNLVELTLDYMRHRRS
jgi:hypothetical protein